MLLVIPMYSWAQEDITIIWKNDTSWYVNPSYDEVYHPNYNATFIFPEFSGSIYQSFKVEWEDGIMSGGYLTDRENTATYLYTKPGIYGSSRYGVPQEDHEPEFGSFFPVVPGKTVAVYGMGGRLGETDRE